MEELGRRGLSGSRGRPKAVLVRRLARALAAERGADTALQGGAAAAALGATGPAVPDLAAGLGGQGGAAEGAQRAAGADAAAALAHVAWRAAAASAGELERAAGARGLAGEGGRAALASEGPRVPVAEAGRPDTTAGANGAAALAGEPQSLSLDARGVHVPGEDFGDDGAPGADADAPGDASEEEEEEGGEVVLDDVEDMLEDLPDSPQERGPVWVRRFWGLCFQARQRGGGSLVDRRAAARLQVERAFASASARQLLGLRSLFMVLSRVGGDAQKQPAPVCACNSIPYDYVLEGSACGPCQYPLGVRQGSRHAAERKPVHGAVQSNSGALVEGNFGSPELMLDLWEQQSTPAADATMQDFKDQHGAPL